MFSNEICKLFKNTIFYRTPPVAASENSCYKIDLPILLQELINGFAICKYCSGTLLLVANVASSHGFGNYNYIFQKRATLFNRSTKHAAFLCYLAESLYFLTNLVTSLASDQVWKALFLRNRNRFYLIHLILK